MKNLLILVMFFLSIIFSLGCSLIIGPTTGTIDDEINFMRGTIVSSYNTPIPQELVVIRKYAIVNGSEIVEREYRTQTDSNGNFIFNNIDNGYYVLYIGEAELFGGTFTTSVVGNEADLGIINMGAGENYTIAFRFINNNSNGLTQPLAFIPGVTRGELVGDSMFYFSVNRTGFYTIVIRNGTEYFCYPISVNITNDTLYLYDIDLSISTRIPMVDIFDFGVNINRVQIAQHADIQSHLKHLNPLDNMVTYYFVDSERGLVPYLPEWGGFSKIEIDLSGMDSSFYGEVLTNYPMLVRFGGDVFDNERSYNNFSDLRFLGEDGGLMRHKIDSWNEETQTLYVWVIFEHLEISDAVEVVFLNYSNPHALSIGDSTFGVAEGFLAAYPLGDRLETLTARDVTGNGRSGVLNLSSEPEKGVIGNATRFNGGNDNVHLGNWQLPENEFSVSLWYNWFGENNRHQVLVSKRSLWLADHMQWQVYYEGYALDSIFLYNTNYSIPFVFSSDAAPLNEWVYLSFSYNNGVVCVYVNGVLAGGCNEFFPDLGVDADIRIGNSDVDEAWNGLIDDVRFHGHSRGAAWFALDYKTQNINQTMVSVIRVY